MHVAATKQRIVLASTSEQENYILKRKIDPIIEDFGAIQFLSVRPQGVHSSVDPLTSMVVLNVPTYSAMSRVVISDVRRVGYRGPVLILSKVDTPELMSEVKTLEKVVLLEKPYEVKDLQGIVRKFILARKVEQRIHRRFNTVQRAEVEIVKSRKKGATTLFNLSRGGAYFEFPRLTDVKVGDLINMTIELNEINRTYAMPAKVVWTTATGLSGGYGVGVEFVGRGDVQSNPLGL